MGSRSLQFAEAARLLTVACRRAGLVPPAFRSPPKVLGRDRSLRRRVDGSVSVAVRLSGRPFVAVVADMVEGVVAANRLRELEAEVARRELWSEVSSLVGAPTQEVRGRAA